MRVGMNHPAAPLPLDAEDRSTLEMWARSATAPHRIGRKNGMTRSVGAGWGPQILRKSLKS